MQPVKLDVKDNVGGSRRCQGKLLLRNTMADVVEWNCTLLKGTDVQRLHMVPPRGTGVQVSAGCEAGRTNFSYQPAQKHSSTILSVRQVTL